MREYRFPIPSFRAKARNLFRLRSRRNGRASENGKRRTPYALRSRRFIRAGKSERLTKKRPRLCLGERHEKMLLTNSFLFRCVSQPPPLRGTSFHRKEGEPCPRTKAFPAWEGNDARIPLSHTIISSESEKSFSFAVKRCMRANESGKPVFPRIASMVFHANGSAELVRKRIATKIPRQSAHARKGV